MKIVQVDLLSDSIVVKFEDGSCVRFSSEMLCSMAPLGEQLDDDSDPGADRSE